MNKLVPLAMDRTIHNGPTLLDRSAVFNVGVL